MFLKNFLHLCAVARWQISAYGRSQIIRQENYCERTSHYTQKNQRVSNWNSKQFLRFPRAMDLDHSGSVEKIWNVVATLGPRHCSVIRWQNSCLRERYDRIHWMHLCGTSRLRQIWPPQSNLLRRSSSDSIVIDHTNTSAPNRCVAAVRPCSASL